MAVTCICLSVYGPNEMIGVRARVRMALYRAKVLLKRAFAEDHTTKEVAGSFSLGVFITMLPTLGTGFLAFLGLAVVFDRMSKLALIASAVVFNPVVKWGVYAASLGLGFVLLGPVEGVSLTEASLDAAPEVVVRLLVGNTLLAVVAAVPSYFIAYRVVDRYRESETGVVAWMARALGIAANPADSAEDSDPDGDV
jgi:uncharacterized protein (DUF2062 family)